MRVTVEAEKVRESGAGRQASLKSNERRHTF